MSAADREWVESEIERAWNLLGKNTPPAALIEAADIVDAAIAGLPYDETYAIQHMAATWREWADNRARAKS